MKKLLAILLTVALMFSFAACGGGYDWEDDMEEFGDLTKQYFNAQKNGQDAGDLEDKIEALSEKLEETEKNVEGEEAEAFQKAKEDLQKELMEEFGGDFN